jgi:hypothetical protein
VDKPSKVLSLGLSKQLVEIIKKKVAKPPIPISSAAAVSTDLPLPNFSFFLLLFLSL